MRKLVVLGMASLVWFGVALARAQTPETPGIEGALAVEQAFVRAVERAEVSVVAIGRSQSRVPQAQAQLDRVPVFRGRRALRDPRLPQALEFERQRLLGQPRIEVGPGGVAILDSGGGEADPTGAEFPFTAYGSGVVVGSSGLILTNYHVLDMDQAAENAAPAQENTIYVVLPDGRVFQAQIHAADPRSDLAVLHIGADGFKPIAMGDASTLRKGQLVLALGNPYAIARDGSASASWGIISNIGRKAGPGPELDPFGRPDRRTLHHLGTLIQTDARLNLGTSGGALINLRGEMIGLTTSLAASAGYEQSAGYAVPMDATMRRIIETLKAGREVEYGFLGLQPTNLPRTLSERGELVRPGGTQIQGVQIGSPASRAGLLAGDVIVAVDGQPIADSDDLMFSVGKLPAGTPVRLTLMRKDRRSDVSVTLAKYPVRPPERIKFSLPAPAWRGLRVDYVTVRQDLLTWQAVEPPPLPIQQALRDGCVTVTAVEPGSPAAYGGIAEQQLITHVNGQPVRSPREFQEATQGLQSQRVEIRVAGEGGKFVDPS